MRATHRTGGAVSLLLGLALAHGVHAQTIYKCRDGSGHIAYQDRACAAAQQETRVEIAPPPPAVPSPDYGVASERRLPSARAARSQARHGGTHRTEALSYECRAEDGEVFYRHSGCPRSIATDAVGGRGHGRSTRGKGSVSVSAVSLTRAEACRRLAAAGSIGRAGREHDDRVSTYERNAGRDPCRDS
ncbi:MAG: DUF4124 domain-containing protein [Lysobacterales bacterium]